MERIVSAADSDPERLEELFKERAAALLAEMELQAFSGVGFELARSDKELAKCMEIRERAERKAANHESRTRTERGELTAKERARKNKKHPPRDKARDKKRPAKRTTKRTAKRTKSQ